MNTDLTINADFPGGNIQVEEVVGGDIYLRQDLRDSSSGWFYWAFRVDGAEGRELTFHFTGGDILGVRGSAVSYDDGVSWQWLGDEIVSRHDSKNVTFAHKFLPEHTKVLFAFCPVYTQRDLDAFLLDFDKSTFLTKEVLCKSRKGRDVELLRLGNPNAPIKVLLTCRHHCCEAMASWVLEGILEAVFAGDAEADVILSEARNERSRRIPQSFKRPSSGDPSVAALPQDDDGNWLRENIDFAVIPFVDKDGVEAGDQGKNRDPHDHNRDYGGEASDSIYPEVRAIREFASAWWARGKTGIFLDIHCPHIRGNRNEEVYSVGVPNQQVWQEVTTFSAILEKVQRGAIRFRTSDNLPFGQDWNTQNNYAAGRSSTKWACELPQVQFASAIEIPYANAGGAEVTPENCRALGRNLAAALREYLESKDKNE